MKRVVIVGGGFGGLSAAKKLVDEELEIILVDRTNHHLFQPLLYQVATAALSPADIAKPIRALFKRKKNIKVIMAEAVSVDKENKKVRLQNGAELYFDYLIAATGSRHSYFGNDEWERFAPGLKTLGDAIKIREKVLCSLEEAERIGDPLKAKKYLTFVIVGGGPTGVELAGAIAEIAKRTILTDFRTFNSTHTNIMLVEALPDILNMYPEKLRSRAKKDLERLGVTILLNHKVSGVNENGIQAGDSFIETTNIIWAAGNTANDFVKSFGTESDRAGRVVVNKDLSVKGHENIFVIGDAASFKDDNGNLLPAVAQTAMQQGEFVADIISGNIPAEKRKKFVYKDKGNMATIGRAKAIAEIKGLKLTGFLAWLVWSFIHVFFLIGYRNRFRVMAEWIWYYISFRHGMRLIVGRPDKELFKSADSKKNSE